MADAKTPTDLSVIRKFFFPGETAQAALKEIKELTPEDKAQLGEGIRNGTLTY